MRLAPLRIHRWLPVADVLSHVLVELIDVPGRDHADVFRSCPDGYARGGLVSQAATPEDYGPRGERLYNHRMGTAHDALGADLIAAALAGRPRELICTVRDVRRKVGSQGLVLGVRASTIHNGVRSAGHR